MDLRDYARILRHRWLIVVHCMLLGLAAAALLVWRATPVYQADAQLFVSAEPTASDVAGLAQGGEFTQQRVQSYADIVNSGAVAQAVSQQLDFALTPAQVAHEISAHAPLNTVLVDLSVKDTSAARAQQIANDTSDAFAAYVDTLETPSGATTSPVKVTVVRRAQLPTTPVSPRTDLDVGLGVLLGLALGVGAAVLRESLDTTVKDPEQVQRDLALATLGSIGFDLDAVRRPLIGPEDMHSARAEQFRHLRTNLQFVDIDKAHRSIVITSSVSDEGKTTTAANLAVTLAQGGLRVMLLDADLRRPCVGDYLGVESAVGLTTVLVGRASPADAVQRWGGDRGFDVLPSGATPPNPSELLGSRAMAQLMRSLQSTYDVVIVDAPPLLPVTDAAVLASVTTGVVVVARHGSTRMPQLGQAIGALRAVNATVYGVVLTMAPSRRPGSYSGYHHGPGGGEPELPSPAVPTAREPEPVVATGSV